MNIVELWREKLAAGLIRFDPDPEVIGDSEEGRWGTVFYSSVRERYKAEVRGKSSTSFDMDLMERMHLADHGGLKIAANPNSLFPGHLVIYPTAQASELARQDLMDITELAFKNPDFTFIHNAERSAASILDWVHFQAYHTRFPLADARVDLLAENKGMIISTIEPKFPAYAIRVEGGSVSKLADLLHRISLVMSTDENPHGSRIALNLIWSYDKVWVVPRGRSQSSRAASYFGGLEMGGIFCVPSASEIPSYHRKSLRTQVEEATFRTDAEIDARAWFEEKVGELLMQL
jgi:hypothetical protein